MEGTNFIIKNLKELGPILTIITGFIIALWKGWIPVKQKQMDSIDKYRDSLIDENSRWKEYFESERVERSKLETELSAIKNNYENERLELIKEINELKMQVNKLSSQMDNAKKYREIKRTNQLMITSLYSYELNGDKDSFNNNMLKLVSKIRDIVNPDDLDLKDKGGDE